MERRKVKTQLEYLAKKYGSSGSSATMTSSTLSSSQNGPSSTPYKGTSSKLNYSYSSDTPGVSAPKRTNSSFGVSTGLHGAPSNIGSSLTTLQSGTSNRVEGLMNGSSNSTISND
jgi:hypothetical protein